MCENMLLPFFAWKDDVFRELDEKVELDKNITKFFKDQFSIVEKFISERPDLKLLQKMTLKDFFESAYSCKGTFVFDNDETDLEDESKSESDSEDIGEYNKGRHSPEYVAINYVLMFVYRVETNSMQEAYNFINKIMIDHREQFA